MFDSIVVGGGPAGSSAAYHLARQGCSVLVLEKAIFPRDKPCTGALSPLVAQWFDFDFAPIIAQRVRRVRYTWKLGDPVTSELQTQEPIWLVKRDAFDQFLIGHAIAKGAVFQDGTPVLKIEFTEGCWQVHTAQAVFEGRYLIAADGAKGPLSHWLGLEMPKVRPAAVFAIPAEQSLHNPTLNFEFGLLKNGCLWSFPYDSERLMGAVTFLGSSAPDYQAAFKAYAAGFDLNGSAGQLSPHLVKLWDGNRSLHTHQAVVIGEAAAIVDPLSAEGIRHGMYSGVEAAKAIHAALQGQDEALADYTATMHQWGDNIQWAQRIAGVFFRFPGIGYRVGIKRPTMTKRMGQLLAGEIEYSDVASRVIKRLSTGLLPGRK